MGIRFYCPNGHKLNVKTFLAGKRGICPRCGVKLEIPTESVRAPSGKKRRGKAKAEQGLGLAEPILASGATVANGAARRDAGLVTASLRADATTPATLLSPADSALPISGPRASAVLTDPSKSPAPNPKAPAQLAAVRLSEANGPLAAVDPIAEAPTAIWYVRPVAGGQFGPAAGDVMRQWLSQRRVGADSMVWRETWADWKRADVVFPLLFPAAGKAAAAEETSEAKPKFAEDADWVNDLIEKNPAAADQSAIHLPRHKTKPNNTIVIVSFFLILLCLLLVAVMITAYFHQKSDATEQSTSMLAPRQSAVATGVIASNENWPVWT